MNWLYITGGFIGLGIGLFITIKQIKTFTSGNQDQLGFDIKLLGGGIGFIMIGLYLIVKYL